MYFVSYVFLYCCVSLLISLWCFMCVVRYCVMCVVSSLVMYVCLPFIRVCMSVLLYVGLSFFI